jgi:membrane protein
MIRRRLIASLMILIGGGVLLLSMVTSALVGIFRERLAASFPNLGQAIQGVNPLLLFGIIFLLFALIFRFLPEGYVTWRDVLPGALFTTVLFAIGQSLINLRGR